MNRLVATVGVVLASVSASPAIAQQLIELDLAGPTAVTLPAPASPVRLRVINRMPTKDYTVAVVNRIIEVDALIIAPAPTRLAGSNPCDDLLAKANSLDVTSLAPKTEREVKAKVDEVRGGLAAGTCSDSRKVQEIQLALAKAVIEIQGDYAVTDGHELVLTITRKEGDATLTWRLTVQGGSRGKWLTTYGMAFVPDRDRKFFTQGTGANDGAPFAIMPEHELGGLKPMPAIFFTWISRSRQDHDWALGPGAGFGLEGGTRPAIFAGFNATYNWNVGFVGGVAMAPEMRLKGRYSATTPPQTIKENLDANALHTTVIRARAFFAVTFRFGSNPFTTPATPAAPAAPKE